MSYDLYYSPGTASMAVHWMLIELAVPFDAHLTDVETGAQRSPEYLKLNPAGRVPTLVVNGVPYGESVALLMLLAERHSQSELAPAPGTEQRAEWLESMIFLANTVLPAMRDWFYAEVDGDKKEPEVIRNLARHRLDAAWEKLDQKLSDGREFMMGSKFSTVDFLAVMLMRWSRNMPRPAKGWQHINLYVNNIKNRPSYVILNSREGLSDW